MFSFDLLKNIFNEEKIVYNTQYLDGLRERNEIRLQEAKNILGNKWLLHPDNMKQRELK